MPIRPAALRVALAATIACSTTLVAAPATRPVPTAATPPAKPAANVPAKKLAAHAVGAAVEVKWGGTWSRAKVTNRRDGWYLIVYDGERGSEWVEPWRVRSPGSSDDATGFASPNPRMIAKIGPPPRPTPGEPPADPAAAAAAATGDATPAADPFAPAPVAWPIVAVSLDGVATVAPARKPWAYASAAPSSSPSPAPRPREMVDRPVTLGGGAANDVHEQVDPPDVNGTVALLCYRGAFEPKRPHVEIVDLAVGRSTYRQPLPANTRPLSVTADGRRFVARADGFHSGTSLRVDVWDAPAGRPPAHVVSFEPYAGTDAFWKDVEQAIALDAERVLTVNRDGHAIAWRVGAGSARPLWQLRAGRSVALSPDRRTLVTTGENALVFVDVADGNVVGTIDLASPPPDQFSFRADGRRLAALAGDALVTFDLDAGKPLASIGLPATIDLPAAAARDGALQHLDGDVVRLGTLALDTATLALVADYALPDVGAVAPAGGRLVAVSKAVSKASAAGAKASRTLAARRLPPAKGVPAPLPAIDAPPGTAVTIDVAIDADEPTRAAVVAALAKQATDRGWRVADGASLRLVCRTEDGASEARTYEQLHGPAARRERTTVTVTPKVTRLAVELDGARAWETTSTSVAGMIVNLGEGQSVQDAVSGAARANVEFLRTVRLPVTLLRPLPTLPAVPKVPVGR